MLGDGDCGQFGKGEDVTEALRPAPSPLPGAAGQARAHLCLWVSFAVCGGCLKHLHALQRCITSARSLRLLWKA